MSYIRMTGVIELVLNDDSKINQLATLISNLQPFSSKLALSISEKGLTCRGMDSCHVCMFDVMLAANWFSQYEYPSDNDNDEPIAVCVPIQILCTVLNMHANGQELSLKVARESDTLEVTLKASAQTCEKAFVIPLFMQTEELNATPTFDYDLEMTLLSANFAALVRQFDSFGSELVFFIDDDNVELSASGESGDMKTKLTIGNAEQERVFGLLGYDAVEDCKQECKFAMKYMKLATKFEKVSKELKLSMEEDKPITLEYGLGGDSKLVLLIAPRVVD